MLDVLNRNIDDTKYQVIKADDRLSNAVAQMNFCQIWAVLICEAFIVIVLILT